MGNSRVYEPKGLGESVAYHQADSTATIYIYDYNKKDIQDDPEHLLISEELSNTIGQIKKLQEMGVYENVDIGDKGSMYSDDSHFTLISIPVTYDTVKSFETGEKISPRTTHSMISIGIFSNNFIKIRYSLDLDEQDDEKKVHANRDEFISEIRKLILEVDLRKIVENYINIYRKDPCAEEAKGALGAIFTYADKSALIAISINSEVLPWMKLNDYPYGTDLLGAYVVGQVNYQLSTNVFENNDKFAMDQVLEVYKRLLAKDEKARIKSFDDLLVKQSL